MVPTCKNCSLKGRQEFKAAYTILAKCQLECRKDPTCFGISFGKGTTSNWNRCFFFYERDATTANTGNDRNFDTWRKNYDCFESKTHYTFYLLSFYHYMKTNRKFNELLNHLLQYSC